MKRLEPAQWKRHKAPMMISPQMRNVVPLAAAGLLAACNVPAPEPTPAPDAQDAVTPPPPPREAPRVEDTRPWTEAETDKGNWRYDTAGNGTRATFMFDYGDFPLVIHCSQTTRTVSIVRNNTVGGPAAMVLRYESGSRTLQGQPASNNDRILMARVSAQDPLLDALAFSGGRFAVEVAGSDRLILPPQAEISRVIEDCR